ncbi:MAG: dicarboxylate/amino acid:cation symporter [Propionicimonas sp.]|uniref:dicarboxylate/amino acid:cation symporter n=1 Tax=Propionicimonas sp. TaxID=1955623 RepID=UPI002B20D8D2|nr:dicarboxylate/amino acid:cation symporter [Propionicimonas sp.]MEA4943511.1 dicarboxylate/amino acid:cation symporter [Propionicimonas sp.]MEA5054073.1 dicarboxylate/amino acid:cation symporter [Propionicimonas sp.]MEA5118886.1 dicarboxylate/amino acid:cation symporter [Propionicimonas sp.]
MSASPQVSADEALTQKPRSTNPLSKFSVQIVIGLIVGVALGFTAAALGQVDGQPNWLTATLGEIGSAYVGLLRLLVVPLIFTAVISSIARLREVTNAARLAVQTLIWFAITAAASVLLGILIGVVSGPWLTAGVSGDAADAPGRVGSWTAFLTGLIPSNFLGLQVGLRGSAETGFTASADFNVLQIIVLAIAFGIAALKVGDKAAGFIGFTESALAVVQKVLWWVIRLAPIGTAALIGKAIATYGWASLASLGVFVVAVYVGLVLVWAIVYPAILRFHGLSIAQFYKNVWPVITLGFVTRSSIGVLPVTQEVTERNLGVPRSYASFAVPLGATTKMDGCAAIYPAVAAIFVAQFYGVPLNLTHYLLIAFVSVLGSAATAGTTGATVMLTLTLSTVGLPLEGVGLLLAVDSILDMGRTALNVTGQALVPTIVAKREGILDEDTYNARPVFDGVKI